MIIVEADGAIVPGVCDPNDCVLLPNSEYCQMKMVFPSTQTLLGRNHFHPHQMKLDKMNVMGFKRKKFIYKVVTYTLWRF